MEKITAFWRTAKKTVTAVVVGLIGWGTTVVASEPTHITASEWLQFATVWAVALGVYSVTNEPA